MKNVKTALKYHGVLLEFYWCFAECEVFVWKKRKRSLAIDILNGPMWDKILRYALPVAATGILGQLFNASDIAIVGNFAEGDTVAAVAAVGANGPVIGLLLNIFIGIALGANVVIANAIGRGDKETVSRAVHTSIVAAVLGGIIVGLLGQLLAEPVLSMLQVPEDVFPLALKYMRIYLLGLPVIFLYNFEAAIFRSAGDTKNAACGACPVRRSECNTQSVLRRCFEQNG